MSSETIKDGGPVHPIPEVRDADGCGIVEGWHGMSLRDWFAGQALAGICGHVVGCNPKAGETPSQADARFAYSRADAMLKAREAQP